MASNIDVLNESTRVAQEAAKVAGLNFQPGATVVSGQIKPTNIPAPLINTNQGDLRFQNQNVNADLTPYLASVIATRDALASQEEKALRQEQQSYISELKGLQSRQESKPLAMNEALDKAGATKITKELQDLEGQIATRTAALESGLTNIEGKAIPMELLTGEQAQLRRQGLAEIGTLQARQQVLQGNLAAAKDAAQRAVDLIYAPEEARINNIISWLDINKDQLTEKEKEKAASVTEMLRLQSEELANKKTLQAYALNASANYPDAGILPSDDVQTVNTKIQGSEIYKTERAKANAGAGIDNGENSQLYAGLSSGTQTAVRAQVSAFKTEPIIQNFATIQEGRNFAQSLNTQTTNPADDQALIYSLAKALDPGSVVREGEYATAQKYAQSWVNAYGKGVTQALMGTGFLSEAARKNIKSTIEQKYKSSKMSYDNLYKQYANGINSLTGRNDGEKFIKDYRIGDTQTTTNEPELPPIDSEQPQNQTTQSSQSLWQSLKNLFK